MKAWFQDPEPLPNPGSALHASPAGIKVKSNRAGRRRLNVVTSLYGGGAQASVARELKTASSPSPKVTSGALMRNPTVGILRSIFAFTALFAVATVYGQAANVVAATSVTNRIEQVTPTPRPNGSTALLNNDQNSFKSIVSLAFNNTGPSLNLLAADNLNHRVVQYAGDFNCSPPSPLCTGPTGTVLTATANIPNPQ